MESGRGGGGGGGGNGGRETTNAKMAALLLLLLMLLLMLFSNKFRICSLIRFFLANHIAYYEAFQAHDKKCIHKFTSIFFICFAVLFEFYVCNLQVVCICIPIVVSIQLKLWIKFLSDIFFSLLIGNEGLLKQTKKKQLKYWGHFMIEYYYFPAKATLTESESKIGVIFFSL